MTMKIAVLGSGVVGETLAGGFLKHGYSVMRGSRDPGKLAAWKATAGEQAQVGDFGQAAAWGEVIVLAVKGSAAEAAVNLAGVDNLAGKTVIDATNPISGAPPDNGVIRFFTSTEQSLMEKLQNVAPKARWVKAFNSVGAPFMVNPDFGGTRPTMFICGDNAGAKEQVAKILEQFGWDTEDMGGAQSAKPIEQLCILWCIPGLLRNQWGHAFKLLKK